MGKMGLRAAATTYLVAMIVIPLAAVVCDGFQHGLTGFARELGRPEACHALALTLVTAVIMAGINAVMGTLAAYVLVRHPFPGRMLVNSLIDLPFAIPTLVSGVMVAALYGPHQALGGWIKSHIGWEILFRPPAIVLVLLFITFPFVVRTVQPVLMELDRDEEEAARTLGASSWTTFWRIIYPAIAPGIVTGTLLAFSRAVGEFGSVVMVAGNLPLRTQTAAVYILGEIESANPVGASAMSTVLLALSFSLILLVDWMQHRKGRVHVR